MTVELLRLFAVFCVALIVGKLVSKIRLPAILGWLIAGVVFGPYLTNIVTLEIMDPWPSEFQSIPLMKCAAELSGAAQVRSPYPQAPRLPAMKGAERVQPFPLLSLSVLHGRVTACPARGEG